MTKPKDADEGFESSDCSLAFTPEEQADFDEAMKSWITFCLERKLGVEPVVEERMMKWFEFSHLPEHLQAVSKPFGELAAKIVETVDSGPERTVALRKLLETKDAAVRAKLNPGC